MENKKNFILWGSITVLALGIISVVYFAKPAGYFGQTAEPTAGLDIVQSPDISVSPELSPSPQVTPRPVPTESNSAVAEEPFVGPNGIKSPATCQVSGEIEFFDSVSYS